MQPTDINRLDFVVYCIETYKGRKNMNGSSVYKLFQNTGALKYIDDCYDALHTFGDDEIVRNIDEFFIAKSGKATKLKDGWQSEIWLIETPAGERYVRKNYLFDDPGIINEEWDTLVFLHGKGLSVPAPVRKDADGIYMQYIENGVLWDIYEKSDTGTKRRFMKKYAKLLYDLHAVDVSEITKPYTGNFIENEIAEIRSIIEKHNLTDYLKILEKLENESANITEQPICFIHRDYHPWNVLVGKDDKLYLIDIFNTLGDYRFDVGWAYVHMRREAEKAERVRFAEDFLCEYLRLKPEAADDFEFFKQLANLRWLANVRPGEWEKKSEFWQYMIKCAESIMEGIL